MVDYQSGGLLHLRCFDLPPPLRGFVVFVLSSAALPGRTRVFGFISVAPAFSSLRRRRRVYDNKKHKIVRDAEFERRQMGRFLLPRRRRRRSSITSSLNVAKFSASDSLVVVKSEWANGL